MVRVAHNEGFHKESEVAARSKAWACGRSLAGIVGSNPGGKLTTGHPTALSLAGTWISSDASLWCRGV